VTVDTGNAGTVARFLPPAAAVLARGAVTVDGDARMRERPLGPLLDALRALGAGLPETAVRVPFTMQATGRLRGGMLEVDASSSSQLISGLLLAAPRYDSGLVVSAAGGRVPSAPHLAMTVAMLRDAGASVDDSEPGRWAVAPGGLRATTYAIEPDLSSASAFLAAAAVTGGCVRLAGWPAATSQPGRLMPELLAAFGCRCEVTAVGELSVIGPDVLHGVDLDLGDYGEAVPTLTAIALFADSPTRLRGIAHLRGQETDRLAALAEEFGRLGARITVTSDGLQITPTPLAAADGVLLDPRADHRLAMAYAVAGLRVPGVQVKDIATTGKTVPDFPERWAQLLAGAC
jgi:3-phosphoshikimate 1-carboxyvinyltransferase